MVSRFCLEQFPQLRKIVDGGVCRFELRQNLIQSGEFLSYYACVFLIRPEFRVVLQLAQLRCPLCLGRDVKGTSASDLPA